MTTPTTLTAHIDASLSGHARAIAALATGDDAPAVLAGNITAAHDRFVAVTAALAALRNVELRDRRASALDAVTAPELRQAIDILVAVRVTIACVSGERAAESVSSIISEAVKLLERELAPASAA